MIRKNTFLKKSKRNLNVSKMEQNIIFINLQFVTILRIK